METEIESNLHRFLDLINERKMYCETEKIFYPENSEIYRSYEFVECEIDYLAKRFKDLFSHYMTLKHIQED